MKKKVSSLQFSDRKFDAAALAVFIVLSVLMLWPLPRYMADRLVSPVDPLLNSWIMAWDVHQLWNDPANLFHANIFYPNTNTLAYSEHLIIPSLMAMPVMLVSKNPILAYNVFQLLCFVLAGYFAYLLGSRLTGSGWAGFTAGFIFAFHPFRFRQIGHIQNLAVFWMPLCLLYFHRLLKKPSRKNMLLFALFFTLQALSCGYMAVFLSFILALAVLYYLLIMPKKMIVPFFSRLALAAVLSGVVLAPFLYPYLEVKKNFAFERTERENIRFSANILGFATVPRTNRNVFYYKRSNANRSYIVNTEPNVNRPIGHGLFPGILTLLLVGWAFLPEKTSQTKAARKGKIKYRSPFRQISRINLILLLLSAAFLAGFLIFQILDFKRTQSLYSGMKATAPVFLFLVLYFLWMVWDRLSLSGKAVEKFGQKWDLRFYLLLGILGGLLSLGTRIIYITRDLGAGPYRLLYKYGYFFKGIRVPERFGLIAMLGLSIAAGFGALRVMRLFKGKARLAFFLVLTVLMSYEFINIPLPAYSISRDLPPVYQWLKTETGDVSLLEYPLETMQQNKYYMFWSTYHWKKLANGSSGLNPPHFYRLRKLARETNGFPNRKFLDYIKEVIKVDYLILHLGEFSSIDRERFLETASKFPDDLRLVQSFDNHDTIYEIKYPGRR